MTSDICAIATLWMIWEIDQKQLRLAESAEATIKLDLKAKIARAYPTEALKKLRNACTAATGIVHCHYFAPTVSSIAAVYICVILLVSDSVLCVWFHGVCLCVFAGQARGG